ncbi:MAG: hypothetical protein O3A97_00525 [Proteobacteria bacterium]|nr:hypothetical protein [Pseudomonadota bacterium]
MTEMLRHPALEATARLVGPALSVTVVPLERVTLLAVWPDRLAEAAAHLAEKGLNLLGSTGAVGQGAGGTALALAPGRWLILSGGDLPDLLPEMGALIDLSHARAAVCIEGGDALALAAKIASVDFDLPRYGPGSVLQTGSAHTIPVTLWRQAMDRFIMIAERSYAASLWHAIADEGAEFGLG